MVFPIKTDPTRPDTIAAISTPPGPGGIAIIRISGPKALDIARLLFKSSKSVFKSHELRRGFVIDPGSGCVLDEALVSVMLKPNSYTREDVVEINSHAGPVVADEILNLTLKNGARLAGPGEFTKRAFLNGRIDLTQAEAVIDIINSKSAGALKAAAAHLKGGLKRRVKDVKKSLADLLAGIEFSIDFSEYDDERVFSEEIIPIFENYVIKNLSDILGKYASFRMIREGIKIAIVGKPNVGKSSLMNAILGYQRAVVTPEPGTTRDYISEKILVPGGYATIIDTAGVRDSSYLVERAGIEKTLKRIGESDIVLFVVDVCGGMTEDDYAVYERLKTKKTILVVNKIDRKDGQIIIDRGRIDKKVKTKYISALRGDGLADLKAAFEKLAGGFGGSNFNGEVAPNMRQKIAIEKALGHAKSALNLIRDGNSPELAAIKINDSLNQLNRVLGVTINEDVLDSIFKTFCVGK